MASTHEFEARATTAVSGAVWLPLGAALYTVAGWRGIILAVVYLVGESVYSFYRATGAPETTHGR